MTLNFKGRTRIEIALGFPCGRYLLPFVLDERTDEAVRHVLAYIVKEKKDSNGTVVLGKDGNPEITRKLIDNTPGVRPIEIFPIDFVDKTAAKKVLDEFLGPNITFQGVWEVSKRNKNQDNLLESPRNGKVVKK